MTTSCCLSLFGIPTQHIHPYSLPVLFNVGLVVAVYTRFKYWNDGSSSSTQSRILHDIHNIVLLVSAVYTCDSGHKLLAHDASILKRFPTHCVIPFVLVSRTGFTTDLMNTCTSLCTHAMNFYKIEPFSLRDG